MEIDVIKRDSRIEKFDSEKLRRSVERAGVSREVAERVARDVEEDARRVASSQLRDKVIRRLRLEDENAAKVFEEYRKE